MKRRTVVATAVIIAFLVFFLLPIQYEPMGGIAGNHYFQSFSCQVVHIGTVHLGARFMFKCQVPPVNGTSIFSYNIGNVEHFISPTASDGRVFVSADNELEAFVA